MWPLGAFGDHLEQELGSDVGQRYVADFIEHDHVVARPARQHPFYRIVLPGFDQFIDEVRGRGESRPSLLSARNPPRIVRLVVARNCIVNFVPGKAGGSRRTSSPSEQCLGF